MIINVIVAIVAFIVGVGVGYCIVRFVITVKDKSMISAAQK